jgi:enoyl-CoA hydratase/carnithine racemase
VIDAQEALRLGVVTEVCSAGELRDCTTAVAEKIARMPQSAQEETKRRILMDGERSWGELFAEEGRVFREVLLGSEPDSAA